MEKLILVLGIILAVWGIYSSVKAFEDGYKIAVGIFALITATNVTYNSYLANVSAIMAPLEHRQNILNIFARIADERDAAGLQSVRSVWVSEIYDHKVLKDKISNTFNSEIGNQFFEVREVNGVETPLGLHNIFSGASENMKRLRDCSAIEQLNTVKCQKQFGFIINRSQQATKEISEFKNALTFTAWLLP